MTSKEFEIPGRILGADPSVDRRVVGFLRCIPFISDTPEEVQTFPWSGLAPCARASASHMYLRFFGLAVPPGTRAVIYLTGGMTHRRRHPGSERRAGSSSRKMGQMR
jgi:hypothetical protein